MLTAKCPHCGNDIPIERLMASAFGRRGGKVTSPRKTAAVRANAKRPRKRASAG